MVATAAHTGARRSELLRMRVSDVDFEGGIVTIRERKRQHGTRTTRRVPPSSALHGILRSWLARHPGGTYLFCHAEEVKRSRTRSRLTGVQARQGPTKDTRG
ncbi:MAG TPA: site-specific integrase [Isosphaeraceae bacterium]|nr:site-specific integrase [Isosphaeraceae bacterium]